MVIVVMHKLFLQLQFLFELPKRLNKCIEMNAYSQAVRYIYHEFDFLFNDILSGFFFFKRAWTRF